MLAHFADEHDGFFLVGFQFTYPGIDICVWHIHCPRYVPCAKILHVPDIDDDRTFTVRQIHQVHGCDSGATLPTLMDNEGDQQRNEEANKKVMLANKFKYLFNHGEIRLPQSNRGVYTNPFGLPATIQPLAGKR